jgi:formylglycine-generating enzyme required for sulfatase activity
MTDASDPFGICGTVIAEKYLVESVIGEGGFSIVYKAEHTIWKQPVALKCFKILANAPVDQRDKLLDGFVQEGKLMSRLSSRSASIVQARDVGTFTAADGSWIPYMVLEWLEGKPLDTVLWDERIAGMRPRELHETLSLLEPAAIAFEIAHANGIAHRDIKPENLFVIGDPRGTDTFVKVLDFGIAKVMGDAAAGGMAQTSAQPTAFTPSHGAPEQFSRSHGPTGPWTDVFAMALVIIEVMRGGIAALHGDDYMQLAVASRDPERRPTPRSLGLEVSTQVEAVFAKALAVNPADRFPSMGKFWTALHQAVFPDSATWNPGSTSGISHITALTGGASPSRPSFPSAPSSSPVAVITPRDPGSQLPPLAAIPPMSNPRAVNATGITQRAPRGSGSAALLGVVGALALIGGGVAAYMMFVRGRTPSDPSATTPQAPQTATAVASSAQAAPPVAPKRTECPEGMVLVPGGRFFMGSDDAAFKLWQPAHKVTLDSFCIDTYEVTVEAYKACSDQGDCKQPDEVPNYPKATGPKEISDEEHQKKREIYAEFCNFGKPGREKHPVNCVTWQHADTFCKAKQKRLPTEAEWEFAARGSDGRKFPWGNEGGDAEHMNAAGIEFNKWEVSKKLPQTERMYDTDDGYAGTAPVGSFPKGKTKFGAYDFVGNVWEWTSDWFATYKADETVNPTGAPAGEQKVIRGGGFNGAVQLWLNPAFRYFQVATASSHGIGFRCALTL